VLVDQSVDHTCVIVNNSLALPSLSVFFVPLLYIFTVLSLSGSFAASFVTQKIATRYHVLDRPESRPDKTQLLAIPLLGGVGFGGVCVILTAMLWWYKNTLPELRLYLESNLIYTFHIGWILLAVIILIIGGMFDDKFTLKSKWLIVYISLATAVAVLLGGLKIESFSYPFDTIDLKNGYIPQILAFVWIILCTASTKFLDGHDGLVSSVGIICLLNIASISLLPNVQQPLICIVAMIWASGIVGFLYHNFPSAKMYLGESGSEIIGFVIGVLSILSGAKVATSGVVVGWFVFDIILVFLVRIITHKPVFGADRSHWHHRLRDIGLSKVQILVSTTLLVLISTHIGVLLGTEYKVLSITFQPIIILSIYFISTRKRRVI
jgi:UDP-GlcNAc:undecaprenyl-phosphate/decaprenyl-phosphate GlcNAc-1-phosphate transferase